MKKILIIEDDKPLVELIQKRLEMEGFESHAVSDGYMGVELAHKIKPDLIVLDVLLPAGDGLGVLKRLKLSILTKDVPVVILTAMADMMKKQDILDVGVAAYIEKPYDGDQFIATIKDILKNKDKEKEAQGE